VLLDGKPVKTPGGAFLALPTEALAQTIAEEWRAQEKTIRPETMFLTKLANTAIDRVAPNPQAAKQQILAFARSDVVCYRADAPSGLVERQEQHWDPLIAWLQERFGARFQTATGLTFVAQDEAAIGALDRALSGLDAFTLAALAAAASLCGSLIVPLALSERLLDPETAFAIANLDKVYQAERWGWDEQDSAKAAIERDELNQISRFLELLTK